MSLPLHAELFQNPYLPPGARDVHAIVTVTAGESSISQPQGGRSICILCDVSGSMEGAKIEAAKAAMARVVQMLPSDCSFFLVAGADGAYLICPEVRADLYGKEQALRALQQVRAFGGTRMSSWFRLALKQFQRSSAAVRQAVLLTDGQNDAGDAQNLEAVLAECEGVFQCECRGLGVDWQVQQLRPIARRLHGTAGLIASPHQIEAELGSLMQKALAKRVSRVFLRVWTPQGARVKFCKQVQPEVLDLTTRAQSVLPQQWEFPLEAWSRGQVRDFHVCIEVAPGRVGDEMLAGLVSLIVAEQENETKVTEQRMVATWTKEDVLPRPTRSRALQCSEHREEPTHA